MTSKPEYLTQSDIIAMSSNPHRASNAPEYTYIGNLQGEPKSAFVRRAISIYDMVRTSKDNVVLLGEGWMNYEFTLSLSFEMFLKYSTIVGINRAYWPLPSFTDRETIFCPHSHKRHVSGAIFVKFTPYLVLCRECAMNTANAEYPDLDLSLLWEFLTCVH